MGQFSGSSQTLGTSVKSAKVMNRPNQPIVFFILYLVVSTVWSQSMVLGNIDFYGNRSAKIDIRKCLPYKEGDTLNVFSDSISYTRGVVTVENCLKAHKGIQQAEVVFVCCVMETQWTAYVGISRKTLVVNHSNKSKELKLPAEITNTYDSLMELLLPAIQSGYGGEDDSQGHALSDHPPSRKLQERLVSLAERYFDLLRDVLKYSKYSEQRVAAAWVIAYYHDKSAIVHDLSEAASDSDKEVRNNAIRALGIIINYIQARPNLNISVPPSPFIALMNSISWSDRNKSVGVLLALTEKRDQKLLLLLKNEALESLIDMASWKSEGHAMAGYMILGRIAGWTDQEVFESSSKNRQEMLAKMLAAIE